MSLVSLQPEAMAILDAAYAHACVVVEPDLIRLAQSRVDAALVGSPDSELNDRDRDVAAVVDQMLIDVSRLDDATATQGASHFDEGGFADFVMAEYIIEARTRLSIASQRLLRDVQ